jgi:O-antigen/teichoic acid export membrane protein
MERRPPPTTVESDQDVLDTAAAGPAAIRGGALRTVGYVAGMLLSVLSVSLMIRHLGNVNYGLYITVVSLVTLVQGITDVGLAQFGVRAWATRSGSEREQMMRNLLGIRIFLTAIGVACATGFAVIAGYGSVAVIGTTFVGVGVILTVAQGTFAVPLQAELRLGLVTAIEFLRQLLSVVAIVALVLLGSTLLGFLAVSAPVSALVLVATFAAARSARSLRPAFDRSEWSALLRSVLPFATASVIASLYLKITVVMTSLLTNRVQNGYYATSFRVLEVLVALPALTVGSALPVLARAARDDHERFAYVLNRLFEVTLILGAWIALVVWLGAGFAMQILTGVNGGPTTAVLEIQGPALAASFVAAGWLYGLFSLHHHRALLQTTIVSLVVSVVLLLVLVPQLQARGAAMAYTGGEVTVAITALLLLRRNHPGFGLPLRVPLRVASAVALGAAIVLIPGLTSLERAVIASVIYVGVLGATHAIPAELMHAVRTTPRLLKWSRDRLERESGPGPGAPT